eukprot:CAMPEP_0178383292 /NCGR_PEP_ID=MMETSP0689_2-20121128/6927_1 /TAXON_ID=160604 /ORGANISM="Amphidinium massartii, Strain CS-259" /LENGTH=146 /DNA_ID=CAMNT_0020003509 /DNA_START=51 /DNA_END=492 /DNA_ORIENTATION=-
MMSLQDEEEETWRIQHPSNGKKLDVDHFSTRQSQVQKPCLKRQRLAMQQQLKLLRIHVVSDRPMTRTVLKEPFASGTKRRLLSVRTHVAASSTREPRDPEDDSAAKEGFARTHSSSSHRRSSAAESNACESDVTAFKTTSLSARRS